ncbi:hypothetical protein R1flu_011873 [Riccia fluitans]|uniref:Uncharacterized protein n=1 Tax=Riccia fluitans TaxID=41844 RepID=A0ABD1Z919_9MARC
MSVCISPTFVGGWNLDAELQRELDALSVRSHLSSSSSSAGDDASEAKSEALLDAATNAKLDMLLNGWREKEKKLQEYELSLRKIRLWQGDLPEKKVETDSELGSKGLEDKTEPGICDQTDPHFQRQAGPFMDSTAVRTFDTAGENKYEHQGELEQRVNPDDDMISSHVTERPNFITHQGRTPVVSPRKVLSHGMDSSDKDTADHEDLQIEEWQNEQKKKLVSLQIEQNLKIRMFEEILRTEEIKLELEKQEMATRYKVLENLSDTYKHMEDEQDLRRLDEDETVKNMLSQAIRLQEQSNTSFCSAAAEAATEDRLRLEEEACDAEDLLYQKQESMQKWLTQVINGWDTGRHILQKQFEEASRLKLAPIYAVAEAVVFAREKEITEGLDVAVVTASRRDFHHWLCKAKVMGLEDAIRSSNERFLRKLKAVQDRLKKEAKLGTKDQYTIYFQEATSLCLRSDTTRAVKAILKRVLQLVRRAILLVGAKSNRRNPRAQDWKTVEAEGAQIGLDMSLLVFLKESICRSRELESVKRVWITKYKADDTGMPYELISTVHGSITGCDGNTLEYQLNGDPKSQLWVGSSDTWRARLLGHDSIEEKQQFIDAKLQQGRQLSVTSHDWLEMLRLQRHWQQHMEFRENQKDTLHAERQNMLEEAEDEENGHEVAVSDGQDKKQDLQAVEFTNTTNLTKNCLTRKFLEEKYNCDREKLRWVMCLDLINMGLTSLGRKGLFRWCPRLKSLSVDMNRLTTFKQVFEGGEVYLEQLSARENLLESLTGLEGLQRLSVLHLDGNLLIQLFPKNLQDGKKGCAKDAVNTSGNSPEFFPVGLSDVCWSRLQVFTLTCNQLTDVSKLGRLCPNLEILDVGSNQLVTLGKGEENALAGLQHLRVLDVGQNKLKGRSLWEGLRYCSELVSLVASRNQLTELPSHYGSALLREIWLNGNAIQAFECKVWLPSLQRLYLQDNLITSLEPVWGCPALEVLDLSFNCISECSQLQHLSYFPNLRSLQLNDNPISDKEDHADYILLAVPWLQELDNEAVAKACRHKAISTLFKSIMDVAGVAFLREKLTRGEAILRGFTNPRSAHKLSFNNREHNENRRSQFLNRSILEVNDVMNGEADEETLWAILLEVKELTISSEVLRSLLMMNGDLMKLGCIRNYSDAELDARYTMTAHQQMAHSLKSKLHAATKERCVRVLKETELSEQHTYRRWPSREDATNLGSQSISSAVSEDSDKNGASHLEWCLEEHSTFDPQNYTAIYTENTEYRLEAEAQIRRVIKLQALARGRMARVRVKLLIKERNEGRERELKTRITRVQAIWRGRSIRKQKLLLHLHAEQVEKKLENAAAIYIQAKWRGYITRLKFQRALSKSKYTDDDEFEYVRIDDNDFLAGELALASYQPADMYLYAIGSDSTKASGTYAKPNSSAQGTTHGIEEKSEKARSKSLQTRPVPEIDDMDIPRTETRTNSISRTSLASSSNGNNRRDSEMLKKPTALLQQIPIASGMDIIKKSVPEKTTYFSPKKFLNSSTCSPERTSTDSLTHSVEKSYEATIIDDLQATERDDIVDTAIKRDDVDQTAPLNIVPEEQNLPEEVKRLDQQSLDDLLKRMGIASPFSSRPRSVDLASRDITDINVSMATTDDKKHLDGLRNSSLDSKSQSTTERTDSQAREGTKKALSDEKKVAAEEIAKDWGFKNARTVEAYLKAREKKMKQVKTVAQQNILRDPETRFKRFKAKLGGPIPTRASPLTQSDSKGPTVSDAEEKHGRDSTNSFTNSFREQSSYGGYQNFTATTAYNRKTYCTRMLSFPLSSSTNATAEMAVVDAKGAEMKVCEQAPTVEQWIHSYSPVVGGENRL